MSWVETELDLKDANNNSQPIIAFTDGENFAFAHPLLDNTGTIIAPATSTLQTAGNASLATIATAAALSSTSALQTAANTLLAAIEASLAGTLEVAGTISLPTGASTAANQSTANTTLASIETTLTTGVSTAANTSGGTSVYAAWGTPTNPLFTNTPTQVKGAAGNLYGLAGMVNPNGAFVYMQFFDLAPGAVTLGTTPPKMVMPLVQGAVYDRDFIDEEKVSFGTMITVAVTTTATGSTAPATGVSGNIIFK